MNDYIINPSWFYWANVLGLLQSVLFAFGCVVISACIIGIISIIVDDWICGDKAYKKIRKALIIAGILILVACFIPSKDTMYQMMIAKYITHENLTISVDAVKDAVDYIIDQISGLK